MTDVKPIEVLLVDDEVDFLESAAKALGRRGFLVRTSSSSTFVKESIERMVPDVAVLDVKMPDVDGCELFREFRARQPDVPVILLTGHGAMKQAFEMVKEGVFEYLAKPCEVDVLADTIRAAYAASKGTRTTPAATAEQAPLTTRVAVIDDEVDFLESITRSLERRGFAVFTATTGLDGLDLLGKQAIDVAVLDVKMPGIDGIEVLERIRTVHPLIEVILLTGHMAMGSAVHGMRQGAFDYLVKPQDVDELAAKIRAAAAKKREAQEAARRAEIDELIRRSPT